jgi:hypothetical protein
LLDTDYCAAAPGAVNRLLQFEAKWMREESFRDVVEEKWTAASGPIDVLDRLKAMHDGLHMWDQQVLKKAQETTTTSLT